jgi:hypothetical protein
MVYAPVGTEDASVCAVFVSREGYRIWLQGTYNCQNREEQKGNTTTSTLALLAVATVRTVKHLLALPTAIIALNVTENSPLATAAPEL